MFSNVLNDLYDQNQKQNKTQNVKTIILPYLLEDLLTHLQSFAG